MHATRAMAELQRLATGDAATNSAISPALVSVLTVAAPAQGLVTASDLLPLQAQRDARAALAGLAAAPADGAAAAIVLRTTRATHVLGAPLVPAGERATPGLHPNPPPHLHS